jgi:hypothetical protein
MRARTLSLTLTAIAPVIDLLGVFRQFLILPSVPRRILDQATASNVGFKKMYKKFMDIPSL